MIRAAAVLSKGRSHPWPKATRCPSSAATTKVFYRGDPGDRTRRPRRPSSPAPPIAIALAAVAALASASASPAACGEDPPRPAAPPRPHHIDAAFGALGKTLQARHERHMVQMAQLLHSLEALAEEAEKEARRTRTRHVCEEADAERAVDRRRTRAARRKAREAEEDVVHITDDEIAALSASPSTVWHIIDAFRGGRTCGREDVKRVCRAAAAILRREPSLVDLSARCGGDGADGNLASVTVVGDLHGHFEGSLTQILEMLGSGGGGEGPGSPWDGTGAVVFNGDFVDRGENSIEVLLTILLLKLAYPNHVYLNRGNHEDSVLATVYGCSDELKARYGGSTEDMWEEFVDVFAALPLAVRTTNAVILHGGLPSADFRLADIARISPEERCRIKTMVKPGKKDDTCRLVRDLMWSDPQADAGVTPNTDRGCGVLFGPDVLFSFLAAHRLKYLIRSHELVDSGYEQLECEETGMSAVTVFSAASYPGGAGFNSGALVRLHSVDNGNGRDISFATYRENCDNYRGLTLQEKMRHTFKAFADVIAKNRAALEREFKYLVEQRQCRLRLQRSFSRANKKSSIIATSPGIALDDSFSITPQQWADAMNHVLNTELPDVNWLSVQEFIAPGAIINYKQFLNLHCSLSSYGIGKSTGMNDAIRARILRNLEALSKVFMFLDVNGDGKIDRGEFCKGIRELIKRNPNLSIDEAALFDSIDEDGSGTIELSEFQQTFKVVDLPYHMAVMMSLDRDKSGTIDRQEFREGVKLLNARLFESEKIPETDSHINALFDKLDLNKNGVLEESEFRKFLQSYYPC